MYVWQQPGFQPLMTKFPENRQKKMQIYARFHPLLRILGVASSRETVGGANSPVSAIKPLQKKKTKRDDVIERAPVKAQRMENHVQDTMKIWHFCLFYVLLWGRLQPPHHSTQIWCFQLFSGCFMDAIIVCFHFTLFHFTFIKNNKICRLKQQQLITVTLWICCHQVSSWVSS